MIPNFTASLVSLAAGPGRGKHHEERRQEPDPDEQEGRHILQSRFDDDEAAAPDYGGEDEKAFGPQFLLLFSLQRRLHVSAFSGRALSSTSTFFHFPERKPQRRMTAWKTWYRPKEIHAP